MPDVEASRFERYAEALRRAGVGESVLLVDQDGLDANVAALATAVPSDKTVRVVAKSLPVPELLQRVLTTLGSREVMTFSVKMLRQLDQVLPDLSHMMGKPVTAAALAGLLAEGAARQRLAEQVVWLVDAEQRIEQYETVASQFGISLRVALELDVGLHRGGAGSVGQVRACLRAIAASTNLEFAGLMGYEPHLPALPSALGVRSREKTRFDRAYRDAVAVAEKMFGADRVHRAIRNTAGSKTIADRAHDPLFNDLSVGSLLLKPLDFDAVTTPSVQPTMYIAAPVLKVVDPLTIPGFGSSRAVQRTLAGGARRGVYIHGGHWLAQPAHPPGLGYSGVIGRSSNQELLVTSGELGVGVDDFVFLRPTQSEAVMLQFGPIAVISGDEVTSWWEPFAPSA